MRGGLLVSTVIDSGEKIVFENISCTFGAPPLQRELTVAANVLLLLLFAGVGFMHILHI